MMKRSLIGLYIVAFVFHSCKPSVNSGETDKTPVKKKEQESALRTRPATQDVKKKVFTKWQAESILGEAAALTDSSVSYNKGILESHYTYTAVSKDKKTGKTGNVYFMLEMFPQVSKAHKTYASIRDSNKDHGISDINDLADEAYFHTDNENFYFLLARKGNKLLRIKVNKLTSNTSRKAFDGVARGIVNAL